MLNQHDDVAKQMNFDVDVPIDTVFNEVQESGDIANTYLNPYTDHQCINLAYNVINKNGQYNIGLRKCNHKYTTECFSYALKPHFSTAHQELNDVAAKTVVYAGFQSENIAAQVVEGLANFFQTTGEDNEDTINQMDNSTRQSTQMLL